MDLNEKEIVPFIGTAKEMKQHISPLYIVSDYMIDYETYIDFKERIYRLVKGSFEVKECRTYPVKFKFYRKDTKTHTLELRHFLINLFLWYPFISLNELEILDENYIFDCYHDVPVIDNYINDKIIETLRDYNVRTTVMNNDIAYALYDLNRINIDFSLIMGLSMNTELFLDLYKNNSEYKDIMETKFDKSLQPHEIEGLLSEKQKRSVEILKSIKENPLGIILRSGTGIKYKQLTEFTTAMGLKPDIMGKIIPIGIENSTLIRGLDKPSSLYIDAGASRKSMVMNKKVMGKAGYFGKIVLELAETLELSTEVSDCNTKHLVTYEIKDAKLLKKFNDKYYKIEDDEPLRLLDARKDKHLIGKKIKVRSAATCALGDCVCAKCIGRSASLNYDIAKGFSGFESEEVTKVVNQSILSAKHLLQTFSEVIEFNEAFDKYFKFSSGEITPFINDNPNFESMDHLAIYINDADISRFDEMDSDSEFNTYISTGTFYVVDTNTGAIDEIKNINEKEIYISDRAFKMRKKNGGYIYFKDLEDDEKIFEVVILNNELTKPLYTLMNTLNKANKDDIDESIDGMCQKFAELLVESSIDASIVAGEIIINRLIRDAVDTYERPDFTQEKLPPYKIYTVLKALEHNRSPIIGLSSQNLKRQLLSDELIESKIGTSYLDAFYKKRVEL